MFLMTVGPLLTDFPKTNRGISARFWNTYYLPIRKRSQAHLHTASDPGLQSAARRHPPRGTSRWAPWKERLGRRPGSPAHVAGGCLRGGR